MTRLEDVADILCFFGPFLLVLSLGGMRIMLRTSAYPKPAALTALAVVILAAMFLSGAFRTGETARACLFIYPYLMFPVAACLQRKEFSLTDRKVLLGLVFGQSSGDADLWRILLVTISLNFATISGRNHLGCPEIPTQHVVATKESDVVQSKPLTSLLSFPSRPTIQ